MCRVFVCRGGGEEAGLGMVAPDLSIMHIYSIWLDIRPADAHTVRPVHDVTKESPNYTHLFSFCV